MRTTVVIGVGLLVSGCISTSGFSTSAPSGDGNVTIPNVFKLKKDAAIAALRRAGVQGDIEDEGSLCGSTFEGKIIELGEVCYQHPAAGQRQGARIVVSIRVQTEDPRHGDIGRNTEWRLMPNLIGMTYDQAVEAMRKAGFERADRINSSIDDDTPGCKPNIVCRQYPDVLTRAGLEDGKVLYVGAPAAETKPAVAAQDPTPPVQPAVATHAPTPPAPPVADQPPAAPPKRWGGNGTAAYRDSDGRVHGPGGPVFMGHGEPCTAKLDHCMRPGVWISADNVIAGKLFRGVPVFQFENKWWTWRGDDADPKHLFRTAVVDKPDQLQPDKPVVFFVEESGERFLNNEYDMLVSSRWSVGVVESVSADKARIKGWGEVPLDTVRVIVEEK